MAFKTRDPWLELARPMTPSTLAIRATKARAVKSKRMLAMSTLIPAKVRAAQVMKASQTYAAKDRCQQGWRFKPEGRSNQREEGGPEKDAIHTWTSKR